MKSPEEKRIYRARILREWRARNPERDRYHLKKYRDSVREKKKSKLLLQKRKKLSAKERRKIFQDKQDALLKKRELNFEQYLELLYVLFPEKLIQKRNYLAYLNREADLFIYRNMKEINPKKHKQLQAHLEARERLPMPIARKIRKSVLMGKRYIGYPPYVPNSQYDKTKSPIYQAATFGILPDDIFVHDGYYMMRLPC